MSSIRFACGMLVAAAAVVPAWGQIQIQVQGGGAGAAKIIVNGQAVPVPNGQVPPVPAVQRDDIVKQLEKVAKDLDQPADKVDLEQVRKDIADAVAKLKQLPNIRPAIRPGIRIVNPIPPQQPAPPAPQPE